MRKRLYWLSEGEWSGLNSFFRIAGAAAALNQPFGSKTHQYLIHRHA
jgi:hypothetical protein